MSAAAVFLLAVLVSMCAAGIFAAAYRDNWLQFVGLTLLVLWSVGELAALARGYQPHPRELLLYGALAAFGVGTAWKVVQHRHALAAEPGKAL